MRIGDSRPDLRTSNLVSPREAVRRRTTNLLEAARAALLRSRTADTFEKPSSSMAGLTSAAAALTDTRSLWGTQLGAFGVRVDLGTLGGRSEEITQSAQFASLVAALQNAIGGAGYDAGANQQVSLALAALRTHFGLGPEAEGALLSLAMGAVDQADDAANAKAAADLQVQDAYIQQLERYLDELQAAEAQTAGASKVGGKGDPGKGQAVVEFKSFEVKDGQVVQKADSTLPQGVKVQGEDSTATLAVASQAQVRQEIAEVKKLIEQAEAQRAQIAQQGSPSSEWARQESMAQALGRIAPGADLPAYGNPITGFDYGTDPAQSSSANALSQLLAMYGAGPVASGHELTSSEIVAAAGEHGIDARRVIGASEEHLRAAIDNGMPPMILGSEQGEPRWLVVTGYDTDAQGNVVGWHVSDPAGGGERTMAASELQQFWANEPWDDVADTRNVMIAMAPAGSEQAAHLPPEDLAGEDATRLQAMEELGRLAFALRDEVPPFDAEGKFIGTTDWLRKCIGNGILDVADGKLVRNGSAPNEFGPIKDLDAMLAGLGPALTDLGYDFQKVKDTFNFYDPAFNEELRGDLEYRHTYGQLFVNGVTADDIQQAQLGDCYFLAALSAIADTNPSIIEDMIKDNGDGTYTVRFYDGGDPVYITVDGDLPYAKGGGLVYGRSTDGNELWPAIIEKAYASWKGGYEEIEGGHSGNAYEEITGRDTDTDCASRASWSKLMDAINDGRPVTADTWGSKKKYVDTGIVSGHVYTVVDAYERDGQKYVVLRNPWGSTEWGDDGTNDGTFEMPWEEFQKKFEGIHFHE